VGEELKVWVSDISGWEDEDSVEWLSWIEGDESLAQKTVSFIWRESMVNISITRDIFSLFFSLLMVFSFKAREQFEMDNEISYYVM